MLSLTHPVQFVLGEDRAVNTPRPPLPYIHRWNAPNLRFADDIDLMGINNGDLRNLNNRLVDRATAYGMEVSTEKSKIMANSTNIISADISMNGLKLEEVTSLKYQGTTLCTDGIYSAEVRIRIASAVAGIARLNRIWKCNTITFASKFKLYKFLVTSILLYGCET